MIGGARAITAFVVVTAALCRSLPTAAGEETASTDVGSSEEREPATSCPDRPYALVKGAGLFFATAIITDDPRFLAVTDLRLGIEKNRWRFGGAVAFGFSFAGDGDWLFDTQLSLARFFAEGGWSPYAGLGLGVLMVSPRWKANVGFGAEPHFGVQLFRDASVGMTIELGCMLPFYVHKLSREFTVEKRYVPVCRLGTGIVW